MQRADKRNHGSLLTKVFVIALLLALYYGWSHRGGTYLSAESGTGYYLGIIGGSMMLVLLLYPLSKRSRLLTRLIPIRYWFGLHMLLGILGPLLILYHANFQLGSTNSSIAMFSMLLVAGSGVIGRYIYTHIHHGLYGSKMSLQELSRDTEDSHRQMLALHVADEETLKLMDHIEQLALQPYRSLHTGILRVMQVASGSRRLNRRLRPAIRKLPGNEAARVRQVLRHYTLALRRTVAFSVYERLFSLWHILHLPLFFMMIITAVIHIFAVHTY